MCHSEIQVHKCEHEMLNMKQEQLKRTGGPLALFLLGLFRGILDPVEGGASC